MSEDLKRYSWQFTNSDTAGTESTFISSSEDGVKIITQNAVLQSNSASDNTIHAKVYHAGTLVFSKDYSLTAGDTMFLTEFMEQVLYGSSTAPDKITLAAESAVAVGETIDCIGCGVEVV